MKVTNRLFPLQEDRNLPLEGLKGDLQIYRFTDTVCVFVVISQM